MDEDDASGRRFLENGNFHNTIQGKENITTHNKPTTIGVNSTKNIDTSNNCQILPKTESALNSENSNEFATTELSGCKETFNFDNYDCDPGVISPEFCMDLYSLGDNQCSLNDLSFLKLDDSANPNQQLSIDDVYEDNTDDSDAVFRIENYVVDESDEPKLEKPMLKELENASSIPPNHQASSVHNESLNIIEIGPRKRGRKKKLNVDQNGEDAKKERLRRNKESAKLSRLKKKNYISMLENRILVLENTNKRLIEKLTKMEDSLTNSASNH